MKNQVRRCKNCDVEFIVTRFDKWSCSKKCSAAQSYQKNKVAIVKRRRAKSGAKPRPKKADYKEFEAYLEVKQFIFKMKRQSYMAGYIDILRLVDVFDKAFPKIYQIPQMNNIERSVNMMFFKLVNWYRVINELEPLDKPDWKKIK